MSDETPETPSEPHNPNAQPNRGQQIVDTVEKAGSALETAQSAFSAIKWLAIALVFGLVSFFGFKAYQIISAPAKAVGKAAEGVTDAVKSGGGKLKDGASDIYNRYRVPTVKQGRLNKSADQAFAALAAMAPTEPDGVKDRMRRASQFAGSDNRVCDMDIDFGNGDIPVSTANDNEAHATARDLGAKDDRLIRMIITAGDDKLGLNVVWDEERENWVIQWKKTTVKKPVSDDIAADRVLRTLDAIPRLCK